MMAEAAHMSGVVSTLFCAITLNHFVRPMLSREGKEFSEGTVRVLSATADTCVFFQVGLDISLTMGSDRGLNSQAGLDMVGWVLLALIVSRTLAIFPLAGLVNFFRRDKLPWTHIVVLWHSAMRGAGSYAFALVFPGTHKDVLVDLTATVVLVSVLFYATTMKGLVRALGVASLADGHGNGSAAHASDAARGDAHSDAHADEHAPATQRSLVPTEADDSDEEDTAAERTTRSGESAAGKGADGAALPSRAHAAGSRSLVGDDDSASYRTVLVGGARVYLPTKKAKALRAINYFDTQVRWVVAGIVRGTDRGDR